MHLKNLNPGSITCNILCLVSSIFVKKIYCVFRSISMYVLGNNISNYFVLLCVWTIYCVGSISQYFLIKAKFAAHSAQ